MIKYEKVHELPEIISPNYVYIEGDGKKYWIAAFLCPCGCKDVIYLNLMKNVRPSWRIKFHLLQKVSISPSIRRISGCKCHFIIRKGRIEFVDF
jgi:hypothetical protein